MEAFAIIGVTVWVMVALIGLQHAKKTGSPWPMIVILILSALVLASIMFGLSVWPLLID